MKKIQIIEENTEISENLRNILETNKYKVLTSKKGNAGLVLAAINQPDLIFSSTNLPDTDGFTLIRKLKELKTLQKTPFIFLTETDQNYVENADIPAADAYIKKPFQQKEVLDVVHKLIGESTQSEFSILIISPDKLFVEETSTFFKNNNYKVSSCSDLNLGYELSKKLHPDLIISEMIFPESDEPSLIDLKKIMVNNNAPVILIGSGSEMKDFRIALNSGAVDYFSKPVNYFSLLTSCELRVLKQKEIKKAEKQSANYLQDDLKKNNDTKKILLVEDNLGLAESISIELEMLGFLVITANNGQEGIQLANEFLPDLIICDIMMPKQDGYYVLNCLRENINTSHIPFIFLTAKSGYSELRKGMNLGADDYLTKPIKLAELNEIIKKKLKIPEITKTSKKPSDLLPIQNEVIASERFFKSSEINTTDFIPISTERKEVKKKLPEKSVILSPVQEGAVKIISEEITNDEKINYQSIMAAELDIFLNNKNETKDYEGFLYKDINVIKINLNRAVEKETRDFYKYIFTMIENGSKRILIDTRSVQYFSSSFLGVLISALKRISFLGGDIRLLMDLTHRSLDMIFLEGILRVFQIYENPYTALNSMLYSEKLN